MLCFSLFSTARCASYPVCSVNIVGIVCQWSVRFECAYPIGSNCDTNTMNLEQHAISKQTGLYNAIHTIIILHVEFCGISLTQQEIQHPLQFHTHSYCASCTSSHWSPSHSHSCKRENTNKIVYNDFNQDYNLCSPVLQDPIWLTVTVHSIANNKHFMCEALVTGWTGIVIVDAIAVKLWTTKHLSATWLIHNKWCSNETVHILHLESPVSMINSYSNRSIEGNCFLQSTLIPRLYSFDGLGYGTNTALLELAGTLLQWINCDVV